VNVLFCWFESCNSNIKLFYIKELNSYQAYNRETRVRPCEIFKNKKEFIIESLTRRKCSK
jgi:hypothetical protein